MIIIRRRAALTEGVYQTSFSNSLLKNGKVALKFQNDIRSLPGSFLDARYEVL